MNFIDNKFVKLIYKGVFYFELGKGQTSRLWGPIPEIMIIIGGLKYLFGMNMTKTDMILFFGVILFSFFIIGFIFKKLGFYDVDMKVQASKDPVKDEMYKAAKKINEGDCKCSQIGKDVRTQQKK